MTTTTCQLCGDPCDTRMASTYQAVTGWISKEAGKGFKLDTRLEAYAHKACLDLKASGHLHQERMAI